MNTKIHSIHFDADSKLLDFIDQKIKKLQLFYEEIISSEVFLRIENVQDLENKIVEIRLEIRGNDVFAKKQSKTFEEATDLTIDALRRQLLKHKTKIGRV
jgi:putative sigma-54 modulation protein